MNSIYYVSSGWDFFTLNIVESTCTYIFIITLQWPTLTIITVRKAFALWHAQSQQSLSDSTVLDSSLPMPSM